MTITFPRFSGEIYVKRSGSKAESGAEHARQFVSTFAPNAAQSLESILSLVQHANADIEIEYFGQSGLGGAISDCTLKVRPQGSQKTITVGLDGRDDYGATGRLLEPGIKFNLFRILEGRSPFNNEAPVWGRLRSTLYKYIAV